MQPVSISSNNRMKWKCKNDCKQQEHRRYGNDWPNYKQTLMDL